MARNLDNRIMKLEQSISAALPAFDWTATRAYEALSEDEREKLKIYMERFNKSGLAPFSDEELEDFERLLVPFAHEEQRDAKEK